MTKTKMSKFEANVVFEASWASTEPRLKGISQKYEPQPELGHQDAQDLGDGYGGLGGGPGAARNGAFGKFLFGSCLAHQEK